MLTEKLLEIIAHKKELYLQLAVPFIDPESEEERMEQHCLQSCEKYMEAYQEHILRRLDTSRSPPPLSPDDRIGLIALLELLRRSSGETTVKTVELLRDFSLELNIPGMINIDY